MDFTSPNPNVISTTSDFHSEEMSIVLRSIFVFLASVVIIVGLAGNSIIIAAIMRERRLHTRGNYFIGSLAAADFLVSLLVCPFSALMALQQLSPVPMLWNPQWATCQIFISLDVTCCTASIMHLCAIAIDRCKSVIKLRYRTKSRFKNVLPYIVVIWSLAILLSVSPLFVFPLINASNVVSVPKIDNATDMQEFSGDAALLNSTVETSTLFQNVSNYNSETTGLNCIVNDNKYYRIVATTIAFYFPLLIIVVIYCYVSRVAWYRIHRVTGDRPLHKDSSYHSEDNRIPSTFSEFNSESFQVKLLNLQTRASLKKISKSNVGLLTLLRKKAVLLCTCQNDQNFTPELQNSSKNSLNVPVLETETSKLLCLTCHKETGPTSLSHKTHHLKNLETTNVNHSRREHIHKLIETSTFCLDNNNDKSPQERSRFIATPTVIIPRLEVTPASENTSKNVSPSLDSSRQVLSALLPRKSTTLKRSWNSQSFRNYRKDSICSDVVNSSILKTGRSKSLISTKLLDTSTRRRAFSINSLAEARTRITLRRERKIIKTTGMVIGAFVVCWLPFFLKEIIVPFCGTCYLSPGAEILINWLGYINSALNPFIYAFSNNDFNQAIRKLFRQSKCLRNLTTRL